MSDQSDAVDRAVLDHLTEENARLNAELKTLRDLSNRPINVVAPATSYRPPDSTQQNMMYALQAINTSLNTLAITLPQILARLTDATEKP